MIDASFLLLIATAAAREIIAGRNWRNVPPVLTLLVFFAGNVIFHVEDHADRVGQIGTRLGIGAAVMLISLIGGRVIPSFTRNWLARKNPGRLPAPFGRFDAGVIVTSALALVAWVFLPTWQGTAPLLLVAGILQVTRFGRWADDRTWHDRLVLVLHVAYAFVPVGSCLLAAPS